MTDPTLTAKERMSLIARIKNGDHPDDIDTADEVWTKAARSFMQTWRSSGRLTQLKRTHPNAKTTTLSYPDRLEVYDTTVSCDVPMLVVNRDEAMMALLREAGLCPVKADVEVEQPQPNGVDADQGQIKSLRDEIERLRDELATANEWIDGRREEIDQIAKAVFGGRLKRHGATVYPERIVERINELTRDRDGLYDAVNNIGYAIGALPKSDVSNVAEWARGAVKKIDSMNDAVMQAASMPAPKCTLDDATKAAYDGWVERHVGLDFSSPFNPVDSAPIGVIEDYLNSGRLLSYDASVALLREIEWQRGAKQREAMKAYGKQREDELLDIVHLHGFKPGDLVWHGGFGSVCEFKRASKTPGKADVYIWGEGEWSVPFDDITKPSAADLMRSLRVKGLLDVNTVAERMGVKFSRVYGWESGRLRPPVGGDLAAWLHAIKIKPPELADHVARYIAARAEEWVQVVGEVKVNEDPLTHKTEDGDTIMLGPPPSTHPRDRFIEALTKVNAPLFHEVSDLLLMEMCDAHTTTKRVFHRVVDGRFWASGWMDDKRYMIAEGAGDVLWGRQPSDAEQVGVTILSWSQLDGHEEERQRAMRTINAIDPADNMGDYAIKHGDDE